MSSRRVGIGPRRLGLGGCVVQDRVVVVLRGLRRPAERLRGGVGGVGFGGEARKRSLLMFTCVLVHGPELTYEIRSSIPLSGAPLDSLNRQLDLRDKDKGPPRPAFLSSLYPITPFIRILLRSTIQREAVTYSLYYTQHIGSSISN